MKKFCSLLKSLKLLRAKKISFILFIIFFQLYETDAQSLSQKLDQYISEYQVNKNIASISAGVLRNGKVIWLGAHGYSDLSHQVHAAPNTIYRIASISKVITAVAIMQLVEKGKINLDADALNYIPYFPRKKWKFTTRQILQHTAGLRDYKPGEFNSTVYYPSTKEAVEVLGNDPLVYKPGTKFLYTTLGYNLLAAIIEDVSGMKFNDYLKKYIFLPAEMNSTFLEFHQNIILNKARGYDKDNYRRIENAPLADLSIKFAGGGIVSTSEDILNFAHALLSNKLIKHSTLDSMLVPTKLPNGKTLESGLGVEIKTDKNGNLFFGHYGFGTGFSSLLAIYPKDSIAVVHLINTVDRNIGSPALNLAAIVQKENFEFPKKSLADKMMEITINRNLDSAITYYKLIKVDSSNLYNISSSEFDLFGYDLLRIAHYSFAIKWFKFFTTEFPSNISGYLGLGDSYYHDNNKGLALKFYHKALEINSSNNYALKMIKKIQTDN
ncbi:MAG: beta-lactamase family protein [Bacteroidetes bacterium]|nr:beta-lactamase family protein [Bacteroidota bacterium]